MSFNLNKTALFAALTSSALLMGAAQAATNAQITITGQIAAATCDLNVTKNNIDLGTFVPTGILANAVIAGSSENFTLNLSNCTKDYDSTAVGATAVNLYAKGTALAANTAYFNNKDGATVGVKLTADGATDVKPNIAADISSLTTLTSGGSATIPMTAELFSTVATPAAQMIEAPITFSVAYN
ncbi:fimbrial protein [Providencia hangzhouensis]|uniref:fimbrial protein n=1 Tax=Providencia hangzhouensis TaxID=3031799 RepID=UPI0034DDA254